MKTLGSMFFARVNVRTAAIAGCVDQEISVDFSEKLGEQVGIVVVDVSTGCRDIGLPSRRQVTHECLTDKSASAKNDYHDNDLSNGKAPAVHESSYRMPTCD